ncbi:hypothetical protein NEOC95_000668 [Neochlamydia sp. AcF95]|nr:hypothetical protein [Neochlamydia sp. AcF95]
MRVWLLDKRATCIASAGNHRIDLLGNKEFW